MFSYVSSNERIVLTDFSLLSLTLDIKFGRSLYESGPATMSTIFSSLRSFSFNLSAIQPRIPIIRDGLHFLIL